MTWITASVADKGFSLFWSILVPGVILLASIVFTLLLYRHFSKTGH